MNWRCKLLGHVWRIRWTSTHMPMRDTFELVQRGEISRETFDRLPFQSAETRICYGCKRCGVLTVVARPAL